MLKCSPFLGQPVLEFSGVKAHPGGGTGEPFISDIGGLLPMALWPDFVIVSTPFLHFRAGVVKAHESVRVQTLRPELAVE